MPAKLWTVKATLARNQTPPWTRVTARPPLVNKPEVCPLSFSATQRPAPAARIIMARPPWEREPGVAVDVATNKRKRRKITSPRQFVLVAQDIGERRAAATADPFLSPADEFATQQELARELVGVCREYTDEPMGFTPIDIGDNEWGPEGLLRAFAVLAGHFETLELCLFGVLRALRDNAGGFDLKSRVWGLAQTALGPANFSSLVIFNVVCFSATFNIGKKIMAQLPHEVCKELNALQVAALNTLGTPTHFAGFGGAVSLAGDRGIAQVGYAHLLPARRCRSWRARVGSAEATQLAGVASCARVVFRTRPHLFSR